MREMNMKKNICNHCHTLFTPAFRHPNQTCCGKRKCVLAKRAKLQKKKMDEDPDYRENQKLSNENWLKENPDYWKKYRQRNPDIAIKNRMMQQIRNQKRSKSTHPSVKINFDELVAKMYLVKSAEPKQQISFWLLSTTASITPIRVVLMSMPDKKSELISADNRKTLDVKERVFDI